VIDGLIAYLQDQWLMLVRAPLPFIVGWLVVVPVVTAFVRHQFADRLATANDRLRLRDDQIAERDARITELQAQLTAAEKSPRALKDDPDTIEQGGYVVGRMHGHEIKRSKGLVLAQALTVDGNFDINRKFRFRNMTLVVTQAQEDYFGRVGTAVERRFTGVSCRIDDDR
jgi:hypothetical protein